jgi:dihydropteroate synthase
VHAAKSATFSPRLHTVRGSAANRYDQLVAKFWRAGEHEMPTGGRTLLMGVLNVTPDSFSDGGQYFDHEAAVAQGLQMVADGADIVDVGGESTRPGSVSVPVDVEIGRTIPVIKRLSAEVEVPLSIDTRKPEVAAAALEAGASIVNDVSGARAEGMFDVVRDAGAGLVLMHMRGEPATMQQLAEYDDVVADVRRELGDRLDAALEAGIDPGQIALDPGLGFAKTYKQNLVLMREVRAFFELGGPLVVGPSRKSFIGKVLGDVPVDQRIEGTAGAVAWLAGQGVPILRVHDVKQMTQVVRVVDAIRLGPS